MLTGVFLDRDGVINPEAPEGEYVTSWAQFHFLPGALDGLSLLASAGVPIVVVTNQRGIARGRMTGADLADIHSRMRAAIDAAGGRIDAIYHCPHTGGCRCRKPGIGMFEAAAADLGLRLPHTAVIGDHASDMEAARCIGALRILLGDPCSQADSDHIAPDLLSAVMWLLGGPVAQA